MSLILILTFIVTLINCDKAHSYGYAIMLVDIGCRFCELMKKVSTSSEYHLMYAKSLWYDKSSLSNNLQTCYTALLKVSNSSTVDVKISW